MISVRTCNFWDSFCTVVPVLGFSLFLPGEKSPSTKYSQKYSVLYFSTSTFSTFDTCVCVCALLYIHETSHTCMYVLRTTCYVSSCFLHRHVCTQHCCTKHCYLLLLLITAVQVVYRSGGGVYVYTEATFDCTTHSWCTVTVTNCTSSTILDQHLCSNGPKDTPRTEFFPWAIPNVLVSTNILSLECSLRQRYNRLCGRLHHPCVLCKWCIPVLLHGIASKHCRNSLMQCCTHRSPRQH